MESEEEDAQVDIDNLKTHFDLFRRENARIIEESMEEAEDYPIDMVAYQTWLQEFKRRVQLRADKQFDPPETTEAVNYWIDSFEKNFAYIDKETFINEINATVAWVDSLVAGEVYDYVILTVEKQMFKAGVWVTLYAWPNLRDFVTHVLKQQDVNHFLRSKDAVDKRILVILFDDASYSGQNYVAMLEALYDQVDTSDKLVRHACANIYTSNLALRWIKTVSKKHGVGVLMRLKDAQFRTLYPSGLAKTPVSQGSYMWRSFFGSGNKTATYFFHKMADHLSVYQQIIAFAPLPPIAVNKSEDAEWIEISRKGMISGCDFKVVRLRAAQEDWTKVHLLGADLSRAFPCPMPPYKLYRLVYNPTEDDDEHVYTYDGEKYPPDDLLEHLHEVGIGCNACGLFAPYVCSGCEAVAFCSDKCHEAHACTV